MATYEDFPIETDPDILLADFIAELRIFWPNWEPNEGSLLYRGAAAWARMTAEGRDVAALVPGEIFRTAGASLFNVLPEDGQEASADTTWVMRDAAGYLIPQGALVSVRGQLFETDVDVLIPPGSVNATPVGITALEKGVVNDNLGVAGEVITVEEALEFVQTVTLLAPTSGGADIEDQDTYMNRLRSTLTLLTAIPVLSPDLATVARTVTGVARAVVLDLYDAVTATPNSPGHATVAVVNPVGGLVPAPTKAEVTALITAGNRRLLNAAIHVIDPTWTPVDITVDCIAFPGAVPADVDALAVTALQTFLDPAKWGVPPGAEEDAAWFNKPVVSLYDVAGALDRVEGLDRVTNILIGLNGGAQTAADHNLLGVVPLPHVGVIAVNVVAP